jgi:hypothetical protein
MLPQNIDNAGKQIQIYENTINTYIIWKNNVMNEHGSVLYKDYEYVDQYMFSAAVQESTCKLQDFQGGQVEMNLVVLKEKNI